MFVCLCVINIWPVKPFETVMVIEGYTNRIELNGIHTCECILHVYLRTCSPVGCVRPSLFLHVSCSIQRHTVVKDGWV